MKAEKAVEVPTIRLSVEETRALMRAHSAGKPVEGYACAGLVDLGLMVRVPTSDAEIKRRVDEAWKRVKVAVAAKDKVLLESAVRQLNGIKGEEEKRFGLTALGKSVARGVTVRMAAV